MRVTLYAYFDEKGVQNRYATNLAANSLKTGNEALDFFSSAAGLCEAMKQVSEHKCIKYLLSLESLNASAVLIMST